MTQNFRERNIIKSSIKGLAPSESNKTMQNLIDFISGEDKVFQRYLVLSLSEFKVLLSESEQSKADNKFKQQVSNFNQLILEKLSSDQEQSEDSSQLDLARDLNFMTKEGLAKLKEILSLKDKDNNYYFESFPIQKPKKFKKIINLQMDGQLVCDTLIEILTKDEIIEFYQFDDEKVIASSALNHEDIDIRLTMVLVFLANFIPTWTLTKLIDLKTKFYNCCALKSELSQFVPQVIERETRLSVLNLAFDESFSTLEDVPQDHINFEWVNFILDLDPDLYSDFSRTLLLKRIPKLTMKYTGTGFEEKTTTTTDQSINFNLQTQTIFKIVSILYELYVSEEKEEILKSLKTKDPLLSDLINRFNLINIIVSEFNFLNILNEASKTWECISLISFDKQVRYEAIGTTGYWLDLTPETDFSFYVALQGTITGHGNKWCTTDIQQFVDRVKSGLSSSYFLIPPMAIEHSTPGVDLILQSYPFLGIVNDETEIINMLGDQAGQTFHQLGVNLISKKVEELKLQDSTEGQLAINAALIFNSIIEKSNSNDKLTQEELKFIYKKSKKGQKKYYDVIKEDLLDLRLKSGKLEEDFREIGNSEEEWPIVVKFNAENLEDVLRVVNMDLVMIDSLESHQTDFHSKDIIITSNMVKSILLYQCINVNELNVKSADKIKLKGGTYRVVDIEGVKKQFLGKATINQIVKK